MSISTYDEALKLMFEYRGIRFELLSDELKAEAIQKLNNDGQLYCQAALLLRRGPEKPYLERVKVNTDNKERAMSNDKASKRPWSKGTSNQAGTRLAAFGGILSSDHIFDAWGENAEANTELIVTAVNEYDALRAKLKAHKKAVTAIFDIIDTSESDEEFRERVCKLAGKWLDNKNIVKVSDEL